MHVLNWNVTGFVSSCPCFSAQTRSPAVLQVEALPDLAAVSISHPCCFWFLEQRPFSSAFWFTCGLEFPRRNVGVNHGHQTLQLAASARNSLSSAGSHPPFSCAGTTRSGLIRIITLHRKQFSQSGFGGPRNALASHFGSSTGSLRIIGRSWLAAG